MKVRNLAIIVAALLIAVALVLLGNRVASRVTGQNGAHHDDNNNNNNKTQTMHGSQDAPLAIIETECRRTIDRSYVADERGRVCTWKTVDYRTGCCPVPEIQTSALMEYSCHFCYQNCCSVYAYCVSCCLNPLHPTVPSIGQKFNDKFDYCLATCRTSSSSVVNEKEWKSPMKYCYPRESTPSGTTNLPSNNIAGESVVINNDIESYPKSENTPPSGDTPTTTIPNGTTQNTTNSNNTKLNDTNTQANISENGEGKVPGMPANTQKSENELLQGLQEKLAKLEQENQQLSSELEVHKRESGRLAHQLEQDNTANKQIGKDTTESEIVKQNSGSSNFSSLLAIIVGLLFAIPFVHNP